MSFSDEVSYLLKNAIPDALDPIVRRGVGDAVPRLGTGGRFRIASTGTFSNRVAADLLAYGRNQKLDGAILFLDVDVLRTLYFKEGRVVGGASDVIFERIGHILKRAGLLDEAVAKLVVEREEIAGVEAAVEGLPRDVVAWALETRVWEVASSLFFMRSGHFVIVDGAPDLHGLELLDLSPTDLALEGLRRYDEWRQGTSGVPIPTRRTPETRPPEAPKSHESSDPSATDELIDRLRNPESA